MTRLSVVESEEVERDYVAHQAMVLAMLRAEFQRLPDHDEIYQEAWTETLEIRARGERVNNTAGLLRTIAWRRARDRARKSVPDTLDPSSFVFEHQQDGAAPPDEQAQLRLDAAALRQIIDSLEPRHAAVLKLRFDHHLDAKEIQHRLGVTPKHLENLVTEAYKRVQAQLGADAGGQTPWARRQRSLLLVCEMGMASAKQRARAQRMVEEDPVCRAMLREMRSTLEGVAVLLPAPVVTRHRGMDLSALLDRLADAKDHAVAFVSRSGGPAAPVEQATAGGLAGLGSGAAAKVVAVCLAMGGGAVVCTQSGVLDAPPAKPRQTAKASQQPAPTRPVVFKPRPIPREMVAAPKARRTPQRKQAVRRALTPAPVPVAAAAAPVPSVNAAPAPSPAPVGSTEFGPGAGGSASPPPAPAQAPTAGGGEFTP